jgi:hypothetical protein
VSIANSIYQKFKKFRFSNFYIKIFVKKQKQKNKKCKCVIHRKSQIFFLVFLYFQYFKYFRRLGDQSRTGVIEAKNGFFGVKNGFFGVKNGFFGVKNGFFFDILFY